MKTLSLSDDQFDQLMRGFDVRNKMLARDYLPGDWNKFMEANAQIAEAVWPSTLAIQSVQAG